MFAACGVFLSHPSLDAKWKQTELFTVFETDPALLKSARLCCEPHSQVGTEHSPQCTAESDGSKKSISETCQLKYLNKQVFKSQCGQKELLFSRC